MLTDLSTTPISETLRRLAVERRSGDIQVRTGKLVKIASFDHGRLVFAASNLKKDRLGEALLALGRITDEEVAKLGDGYDEARQLFEQVATGDEFIEFLTLPAYAKLA